MPTTTPEPRASANVNTLHFNGSIVCHPDTTNVHEVRQHNYKLDGKCHRGQVKYTCPAIIKYFADLSEKSGKPRRVDFEKPCILDKSPEYCAMCPAHLKAKRDGSKEKSFEINNRVYNEIADRAAWLFNHSEHKLLFITLTFPEYKRKTTEHEHNEAFSRFIENCRKTYDCGGYIAVREGDGVNKRYHFHLIISLPFIDFRTLNDAWLHTISDFCQYSKNALTTDREARFIKSVTSAVRYICKYVSKARGVKSATRVYFVDRDTAQAVIKTRIDQPVNEFKDVYKTITAYQYNDYVCRYTIRDKAEAEDFFKTVVLTLFNSLEGSAELYFFPSD